VRVEKKKILQLDTCNTRIAIKYLDTHFFLKKVVIISLDDVCKKIETIAFDNFPKDNKIMISILS